MIYRVSSGSGRWAASPAARLASSVPVLRPGRISRWDAAERERQNYVAPPLVCWLLVAAVCAVVAAAAWAGPSPASSAPASRLSWRGGRLVTVPAVPVAAAAPARPAARQVPAGPFARVSFSQPSHRAHLLPAGASVTLCGREAALMRPAGTNAVCLRCLSVSRPR